MSLHVLIVDDNRDHADSLAWLVGLWGYRATVAYDGEAGLRAARETFPDCLILDINMPRMDGYTVAEVLRHEGGLAGAKLVAVSAYSDPGHVRRTTEAGFDYRLTKPADPVVLLRMLKMIEHIIHLAEKTEKLAERNAAIVERTETIAARSEALVVETKELIAEVRDDLKDVKADMRDIKDELRDVKDRVDKASDGEGWKTAADGE